MVDTFVGKGSGTAHTYFPGAATAKERLDALRQRVAAKSGSCQQLVVSFLLVHVFEFGLAVICASPTTGLAALGIVSALSNNYVCKITSNQ